MVAAMKSRWTTHRGQRVLYCDFSGFKSDVASLSAEVDAVDQEIIKEPKGSALLLVDVSNTVASAQVVDIFKHSAKLTNPYVSKQAVIGLSGFKRFLADVIARFSGQGMRLFDSEVEAMDWLVGVKADAGLPVGSD